MPSLICLDLDKTITEQHLYSELARLRVLGPQRSRIAVNPDFVRVRTEALFSSGKVRIRNREHLKGIISKLLDAGHVIAITSYTDLTAAIPVVLERIGLSERQCAKIIYGPATCHLPYYSLPSREPATVAASLGKTSASTASLDARSATADEGSEPSGTKSRGGAGAGTKSGASRSAGATAFRIPQPVHKNRVPRDYDFEGTCRALGKSVHMANAYELFVSKTGLEPNEVFLVDDSRENVALCAKPVALRSGKAISVRGILVKPAVSDLSYLRQLYKLSGLDSLYDKVNALVSERDETGYGAVVDDGDSAVAGAGATTAKSIASENPAVRVTHDMPDDINIKPALDYIKNTFNRRYGCHDSIGHGAASQFKRDLIECLFGAGYGTRYLKGKVALNYDKGLNRNFSFNLGSFGRALIAFAPGICDGETLVSFIAPLLDHMQESFGKCGFLVALDMDSLTMYFTRNAVCVPVPDMPSMGSVSASEAPSLASIPPGLDVCSVVGPAHPTRIDILPALTLIESLAPLATKDVKVRRSAASLFKRNLINAMQHSGFRCEYQKGSAVLQIAKSTEAPFILSFTELEVFLLSLGVEEDAIDTSIRSLLEMTEMLFSAHGYELSINERIRAYQLSKRSSDAASLSRSATSAPLAGATMPESSGSTEDSKTAASGAATGGGCGREEGAPKAAEKEGEAGSSKTKPRF